jgi:hypothetical protein
LAFTDDAVLDLVPEMADQALDRPGRRIAKRADRVPLDLLGDVEQHVDLLDLGLALHQPVHHPHHPARALAAGRALAAAFVLVELRQPPDRLDDVGGLVHHDHRRGAQARPLLAQPVEVHDRLAHRLGGQQRHRRAAGDHRLEVVPAARGCRRNAVDQLLEGDRHRLLDHAGVVHVARDGEDLGARVVRPPEGPRTTPPPRRRIVGTTAMDSTLFTVVGQP